MPRILVDLSLAPLGGAATYCAGLAIGLARGKIASREKLVVLVDRTWAGDHTAEIMALRDVGVEVDDVAFPPPGTVRARLGRGSVLRKAAKRHRADVCFIPRDAPPRTKSPLVMLTRNLYAWQPFRSSQAVGGRLPAWALRLAAWRAARRAAAVLAVSQVMAEALEPRITADAVVHHGCLLPAHPRSGLGPPNDAPRQVIMVGNIMAHKEIEVVINAVAHACDTDAPWELSVYGRTVDVGYAAILDDLAVRGLGSTVLAGPLDEPALACAYQRADVFVMGGVFESFCFPLVEAMRSGCVVVAPACPLVDELCGDVAVTYPQGDAGALATALGVAWDRRAELSAAGIERSLAFTWERTAEKTIGLVRASVGTP